MLHWKTALYNRDLTSVHNGGVNWATSSNYPTACGSLFPTATHVIKIQISLGSIISNNWMRNTKRNDLSHKSPLGHSIHRSQTLTDCLANMCDSQMESKEVRDLSVWILNNGIAFSCTTSCTSSYYPPETERSPQPACRIRRGVDGEQHISHCRCCESVLIGCLL